MVHERRTRALLGPRVQVRARRRHPPPHLAGDERQWPTTVSHLVSRWWLHVGCTGREELTSSFGKHYTPNPWILPGFRSRGYHVVSVGYRLIPHVSFYEIMSDSEAAFAWLQSNLPSVLRKFNAQVDLSRWVTGGDSAGAAIAAWGSLRFSPAPTAFVSIYGMSTCTDPYFLPPGRDPPLDKVVNSLDAIQAFCDERDPAKAEFCGVFKHELPPNLTLAQLQAYWGVGRDWRPPATAQMRIDMMTYEYERRLMSVIGGRRETFATDEEWLESLKPLDVVRQVHERKRFPPAFMVHGEKDWTVPVYHTKNLEATLRAENLPVRTIYPPHELHNFDLKIAVSTPFILELTAGPARPRMGHDHHAAARLRRFVRVRRCRGALAEGEPAVACRPTGPYIHE